MVSREPQVTSDQLTILLESELKKTPKFFIGQDVVAVETTVLNPGDTRIIEVGLNRADYLPPVSLDSAVLVHLPKVLAFSGRSRGIQAGLEFRTIPDAQLTVTSEDIKVDMDAEFLLPLKAHILGGCPIVVRKSDRLGRFFHPMGSELLVGDGLAEIVNSGNGITISGKNGEEWFYVDEYNQILKGNQTNKAAAIGLAIDDGFMKYVDCPYDRAESPLSIFTNERDYRRYLEEIGVLRVFESGMKAGFLITRTRSKVTLLHPFNAVLQHQVEKDIGVHAESHLIEGGKTDWQLHLEIVSNQNQFHQISGGFVIIRIYKDRDIIP